MGWSITCGVIAFALLGPCLHYMLDAWYEKNVLESAGWLFLLLVNLNTIRVAIKMFYGEYDGREDEEDSAGQ